MTPLYFGSRERLLFGLYTPARSGAVSSRAVVLCAPFGQEYLRAHRSLRQLAVMLADVGYHVLRFDYFGTGDSAGELSEADVAGWEDDIRTAIDELRDTCNARRVSLVGLRLGAALAARVAARSGADVDAVVLWDPIVDGGRYVRGLLQDATNGRRPPRGRPDADGACEVLGFSLSAALAREIGGVNLHDVVASMPARALVLVSDFDSAAALQAMPPRADGSRIASELVKSEPVWVKSDDGPGVLPVHMLQRITQWATP
jgi:pimeloyl-ACP methyl ester carboxylesterase